MANMPPQRQGDGLARIFGIDQYSLMGKQRRTANIGVQLSLPPDLARFAPPPAPWLSVVRGEPKLRADRTHPIRVHPLPSGLPANALEHWLELLGSIAHDDATLDMVVARRIPPAIRELLETRGVGYLDWQGNLHLAWHGGVVHVGEARPAQTASKPVRALGASSVRAIQQLLMWQGEVKVHDLAERAQLSPAQAHATLVLLEREGWVRSEGRGPNRRRLLGDRGGLLDWLAQQAVALRRDRSLDCTFYARRPEELFRTASMKLREAGVAHGLTGAAAASIYGTGPTAVPLAAIRVDPSVTLEHAAEVIGAEPTQRGQNLRLIRDTGGTGSKLTDEREGVHLAPKVRIYLDLKADRRGEDLAEQFREVNLGF